MGPQFWSHETALLPAQALLVLTGVYGDMVLRSDVRAPGQEGGKHRT